MRRGAIPGYPPRTLYRTLAWDLYGVLMCGSSAGCTKGFSKYAHEKGKVDRAGVVHWDRADHRASRRGTRNLFKLLALAVERSYWYEPDWKRLWLVNLWAAKEIKHRLHIMVRMEWNLADRQKAHRLALRRKTGSLRYQHRNFYSWLLRAGVLEVQSQRTKVSANDT